MRVVTLTTIILTAASCRASDGSDVVLSAKSLGEGIAAADPAGGADQSEELHDPRAVDALTRMDLSLNALDCFTLEAHTSRDIVVQTDFKLQRNADAEIIVDRPDRLAAKVTSERGEYLLYVDDQKLTILDPEKKLYAQMPAEETLGKTLHAAAERHGLETPLVDFLAPQDRLEDATAYGYLDEGKIDGKKVEHVAVRRDDVDWQVWIDEQTGLPLKYVITTRDEWTDPQFIAEMKWNTSPSIDATQFTFNPPSGTVKIPFIEEVVTSGEGQGQGGTP